MSPQPLILELGEKGQKKMEDLNLKSKLLSLLVWNNLFWVSVQSVPKFQIFLRLITFSNGLPHVSFQMEFQGVVLKFSWHSMSSQDVLVPSPWGDKKHPPSCGRRHVLLWWGRGMSGMSVFSDHLCANLQWYLAVLNTSLLTWKVTF